MSRGAARGHVAGAAPMEKNVRRFAAPDAAGCVRKPKKSCENTEKYLDICATAVILRVTMDDFERAQSKRVGVGGWYCYCCDPAPKDRQKVRRFGRRKLRQQTKKLLSEKEHDMTTSESVMTVARAAFENKSGRVGGAECTNQILT